MLCSANELVGNRVQNRQGDVGTVRDLYFDDLNWVIRYLVVETGDWLEGRWVLLAPASIHSINRDDSTLLVELEREQIAQSPSWEREQTVSQQYEKALHEHYNWPLYWARQATVGMGSAGVYPVVPTAAPWEVNEGEPEAIENPHLRSVQEVIDYDIEANDGSVGHIADFIVNGENWAIFYMVIDTSRWLRPGKHVLLAPTWVEEIDWEAGDVRVDLDRGIIEKSPEFDLEQMIDREYMEQLDQHYGQIKQS